MQAFVHTSHPQRVVFGPGNLDQVRAEVERLGANRALVLCTPEQVASAEQVAQRLGNRCAGIFPHAVMHVPIETARAARAEAARLGADCAVAIGGGSTTGLGKAIALESSLPILAIPTTYAGSEMTSIWGLTEAGVKKTGRDARVLPRTVIYDPLLTLTLPLALSVTSAMNAIAHAAEGLYAHDGNPVVALMAEEAIRASATALPALQRNPQDLEARSDLLYGAWLAGGVLSAVAMGLHHKLCHTLGGSFKLPHAEVHTVMLPHALAYNADAAAPAMARIAHALRTAGLGFLGEPGDDDADLGAAPVDSAIALQALAQRSGAPTSLAELGMTAEGLDRAADLAVQTPYPNPRALEREAIRALLQRAFDGSRPQS